MITHRGEGDAQDPGFWHGLVSSSRERKISRASAIFALRAILLRLQGFKAHRAQITFDHDPVTIGELFDLLEKLCGAASGWQTAQELAGY